MLLKWTDLALIDLEEIESYISQENSPIVAIDVVIKIIDSVNLILSDHPRAGRQLTRWAGHLKAALKFCC